MADRNILASALPRRIQCRLALAWVQRISPVYTPLSTNVLREVCQFFVLCPALAKWNDDVLTVYYPLTGQFRTLSLCSMGISLNYYFSGECIPVEDEQVLLCGGLVNEESKPQSIAAAFMIDCDRLTPLSEMQEGRVWHGLSYRAESLGVYVFGGLKIRSFLLKSCEQYEIARNSWVSLPDMKEAKFMVSTCSYRRQVYVYGNGSSLLEVFSTATKEFTVAPILFECSVAVDALAIWNDRLAVFHEEKVQVFDASTYSLIRESGFPRIYFPRPAAVVNDILFALECCSCNLFDLHTMRACKRISIR